MAYQSYGGGTAPTSHHPPQHYYSDPAHPNNLGRTASVASSIRSSGSTLAPAPSSYAEWQQQQQNLGRTSSMASSHTTSAYPPPNHQHQRPHKKPAQAMPPCPPGVDPQHWKWFCTVDADGSGQITPAELQQALVNGDHTRFDIETVKMLFGMFDIDRNGTIGFNEFVSIFTYVEQWQAIFRRFDSDRSGTIDAHELSRALGEFQYNLSPRLIDLLCKKFSAVPVGPSKARGVTFDRFVRCCVSTKTLTDAFMAVDTDRDGWATISYEQFMDMILSAP